MASDPVIIVGAGIGGMACAIDLAARGLEVTVLERASGGGGKMRTVEAGGLHVDSGPTVLTMRWVFDALFDAAGTSTDSEIALKRAEILARHAWDGHGQLDLHATVDDSAEAIGRFFGAASANSFRGFAAEAGGMYATLRDTFLNAARPGPVELTRRIGFHRVASLLAIRPFTTLWGALAQRFDEPHLRQLFGRYATYSGSSPFAAPATLMLIAHVEQDGVWLVEGGMHRLAEALQRVAERRGVRFRFDAEVAEIHAAHGRVDGVSLTSGERLDAGSVVWNGDINALATGLAGKVARRAAKSVPPSARSLSALTWSMSARAGGFPLARHSVFFGGDYKDEFDDLVRHRRLPRDPTVYVCAQDRSDGSQAEAGGRERLFVLTNAPPCGDTDTISAEEIESCRARSFARLRACGLELADEAETVTTTPMDFHRLFPATGGALYGRASHGWMAAFRRPGSATAIEGLYLAGGSTHPGAGVPMAALSGRLAAQRLFADLGSIRRFRRAGICGGTSTEPAMTGATRSP